jgi:hypothetical protein
MVIPAHVEIRDPNGVVIASEDFNSSLIQLHVRPTVFGNYTATITNLQDKSERLPTEYLGYTIHYGLGHLTSVSRGVSNPVGDLISGMYLWGAILIGPAVVMVIIAIARAAYILSKKTTNTQK